MTAQNKWWWLSFAGKEGFRGGVLTRSSGLDGAITKTHALGINPGGEVLGCELPDEVIDTSPFTQLADKLLSKKEIEDMEKRR